MTTRKSVLVYLVNKNRVCLGMKKVGYSKGKWNGFGGRIEKGEGGLEAAAREVWEEAGVRIKEGDLIKKASFYYYEPEGDWQVEVFVCKRWQGEVAESEEMRPEWFETNKLPLGQMWENDKLWIERVLVSEDVLEGTFWHDNEGKVLRWEINR